MRTKIIILLSLFALFSCEKKEMEETTPDNTAQFNKVFNNTIVLTTMAFISGDPRTVEPGMPMKFHFKYNKNNPDKLLLEFKKFHYGKMPLSVNFRGLVDLQKDTKNGVERVRLYCNNAATGIWNPAEPEAALGPGATGNGKVDGYFYPETNEIEVFINFNMMNVTAYSVKQKIDLSRLARFDKEMKDYIKIHDAQ